MDEASFLYGRPTIDLAQTKEVKVRLPIGHLVRLHGLKLLSGRAIQDVVTEALDRYFDELKVPATTVPEGPGVRAP